jgi:hypothetical protein
MTSMKKPLLPILLLAAMQLFALKPLCGSVAETASQDRPNIVIFIADDLGYGELGCQGNPQIPTPHIDAISENENLAIRFPETANELISEWGKLNQQMVEPLF